MVGKLATHQLDSGMGQQGGGGGDRLVSIMQPGESLYIEDFNLDTLQMNTQLILPDMEPLRINRRGMNSPSQLHNLMPANHGMVSGHLSDLDTLRNIPHSLSNSMMSSPPTHHTLTNMKYPGTPPDTPPGSSPSPPYHTLTTSMSSPSTINVEVSEILWKNYQDQPIDLRGQCELGRDELQEKWLSSLDYSGDESGLRQQLGMVSNLPAAPKLDANGVVVDDEQVVSNFP